MWVTSFGNGMKTGNISPTGMADFQHQEREKLLVSPNPGDGECTIKIHSDNFSAAEIRVVDMTGKKYSPKT